MAESLPHSTVLWASLPAFLIAVKSLSCTRARMLPGKITDRRDVLACREIKRQATSAHARSEETAMVIRLRAAGMVGAWQMSGSCGEGCIARGAAASS
mmetsp:Transcript_25408/g.84042  ORF Transcript_25408/g.84042 Transcript_25408/m.84042 type:complete len:98 (-) Transcript_25408:40-333(-)